MISQVAALAPLDRLAATLAGQCRLVADMLLMCNAVDTLTKSPGER